LLKSSTEKFENPDFFLSSAAKAENMVATGRLRCPQSSILLKRGNYHCTSPILGSLLCGNYALFVKLCRK